MGVLSALRAVGRSIAKGSKSADKALGSFLTNPNTVGAYAPEIANLAIEQGMEDSEGKDIVQSLLNTVAATSATRGVLKKALPSNKATNALANIVAGAEAGLGSLYTGGAALSNNAFYGNSRNFSPAADNFSTLGESLLADRFYRGLNVGDEENTILNRVFPVRRPRDQNGALVESTQYTPYEKVALQVASLMRNKKIDKSLPSITMEDLKALSPDQYNEVKSYFDTVANQNKKALVDFLNANYREDHQDSAFPEKFSQALIKKYNIKSVEKGRMIK